MRTINDSRLEVIGFGSVPASLSEQRSIARELISLRTQLAELCERVPDGGVTAEHQRVIKMLLGVFGAACELADDSCECEVDGEQCVVVPCDSFARLSDCLDAIENSLPSEYEDLPNTVLQWAAVPRHALQPLLKSAQKDGDE